MRSAPNLTPAKLLERTRLTVDRELFEEFFVIDSFARVISNDAMAMGIIRTPYEAIEMLCIANRNMAEIFVEEMALELEQYGKDDEYWAALQAEDSDRANRFISEYISGKRHAEIYLSVMNEVREDLGLPEFDADDPMAWPAIQGEYDPPALPPVVEPAYVPIAPGRFEEHFRLTGTGFRIALDAVRQSVIATPYQVVEMICNANLMRSARMSENALRLVFDHYTPEELMVAIQNGTFSGFIERAAESEEFETMAGNLRLEIRTAFGVPETKEQGTSEKYKLWAGSRRKPVN